MLLCYYLRTMKLTNGVLFIVALWSLVLQVLQMFWRYPERREMEWNYSVMSEVNKIDMLLMGWLFRSAHLGVCEGANLDEGAALQTCNCLSRQKYEMKSNNKSADLNWCDALQNVACVD